MPRKMLRSSLFMKQAEPHQPGYCVICICPGELLTRLRPARKGEHEIPYVMTEQFYSPVNTDGKRESRLNPPFMPPESAKGNGFVPQF